MFDCRQPEEIFWRRMNPARLHALFNAYFRPAGTREDRGLRADGKTYGSLSEYLRGG